MFQKRRFLVTGASSGIGEALAKISAQRGAEVILLSDHLDSLRRVSAEVEAVGGCGHVEELDLSSSLSTKWSFARLEEKYGPIDTLVNNAGVGLGASLLDTTDEHLRMLFEVNFFSAHHLMKDAFYLMRERGRGWILNVTSAAARCGSPGISAYSASKAAVHALTQALRIEAAGSGVTIAECLPISVKTKFFENVRGERYNPEGIVLTTEHVAEVIANALKLKTMPAEILPFRPARLAFIIEAALPGLFSLYGQRATITSRKKQQVEQQTDEG